MDINYITDIYFEYIPIVVAACMIIGYLLKRWIKDTGHKWIPTILAVTGAVLACVAKSEISLALIVSGAFSGLASTGMHQLFKQIVRSDKENKR